MSVRADTTARMALGRRDPQRGLFEASARFRFDLEKLGFYGKLAEHGAEIFRDDDFAALYKEGGRYSAPPSLKALALLLQFYEGVSDEEVIDRLRFDLRWKTALNLDPLSLSPPFVKSTFQAFRVGLVLNNAEGIAFMKSLDDAREKKILSKKDHRTVLDATPVRGRGAVKDTFNLLSDAIRATVRALAKKTERTPEEEAKRLGIERHFEAASIKGSENLDWTSDDEKRAFLGRVLKDCDVVVQAAREAKCDGEPVEFLGKIIEQNVDRTTEPPSIPRQVAPDRIVSVSDPEMRHGHKSSGKIYSGHKAHLAVDAETGIVTAVLIGKPGEADGARVGELLDEVMKNTRSIVKEALGDCAYGTLQSQEQAGAREVHLMTKMPKPPATKFGPADFFVSEDGTEACCPVGHPSASHGRKDGGVLHRWSPDQCSECPFRVCCTDASARTLAVGPQFHDRRRREEWAQSDEGRATLRARVVVEHTIAAMKNLGAGIARYFGHAKTRLQWLWTAAVVNLQIVFRLVEEGRLAKLAA
jgi:hypothetical protein